MSVPIEGYVAPGFDAVGEVFASNFTAGVEVGASFCVMQRERVLVDLWGGFCDQAGSRPWCADTLVNVYSTTKGLAAAAVAAVVASGSLDYQAPVQQYWPELRAARSGLTVTQLLSHQAGLCAIDTPISVGDLYDWGGMCRRLEAQEPRWPPGTAAGYHAITWGFLVGELVRRATGQSLAEVFRQHIAAPLDADCYIGLPDAEFHCAADLIGPNRARKAQPARAAAEEAGSRPALNAVVMENPLIRPYADACSTGWRRAELAASNGHANGRGIARIYAALAGAENGGDIGATQIVPAEQVAALRTEVWGRQPDLVLGYPMRRGRGVNLNTRGEFGPSAEAFGHTGTGGSLGFADPERGIGVGYAMNQLWGGTDANSRAGRLVAALYGSLDAYPS